MFTFSLGSCEFEQTGAESDVLPPDMWGHLPAPHPLSGLPAAPGGTPGGLSPATEPAGLPVPLYLVSRPTAL